MKNVARENFEQDNCRSWSRIELGRRPECQNLDGICATCVFGLLCMYSPKCCFQMNLDKCTTATSMKLKLGPWRGVRGVHGASQKCPSFLT